MDAPEGLKEIEDQLLRELQAGHLKITGAMVKLSTPPQGVHLSSLDWSAKFGFALLCTIWNTVENKRYEKVVFYCPGLSANGEWLKRTKGFDEKLFSPEGFPPRLGKLIMAEVVHHKEEKDGDTEPA